MSSESVEQRVELEERNYADKMIGEGRMWSERFDLYGRMTRNLDLAFVDQNEPFSHVDFGTGPGNLLMEMSKKMLARGQRNFLLLGVDVNPLLAQHAVEQAASIDGLNVSSHLQWKRDRVKGKLKKVFSSTEQSLDQLDLTPDGRIVILLDDMRWNTSKILPAVLERIKPNAAFITMSHTLMGAGGDMALETSEKPLRMERSDALPELHRIIREVVTSVHQHAARHLETGGYLYRLNRAIAGAPAEMYRITMEEQIPKSLREHFMVADVRPITRDSISHIEAESGLDWSYSPDSRADAMHFQKTLLGCLLRCTNVPVTERR